MSTKLSILGCEAVGKSCLAVQYLQGCYAPNQDPTIEQVHRTTKHIDGKDRLLEVWDSETAIDRVNWDAPYVGARGVLLLYSMSSLSSFDELAQIYKHLQRVRDQDFVPAVVVESKCDLSESEREVPLLHGKDFARHIGAEFVQTSAKERINVGEAFAMLVRLIDKSSEPTGNVRHGKPPTTRTCQLL
jgi:GTPase KRas